MNIRRFVPDDFGEVLSIEQEAFNDHNPFVYINFYEININGFLVAVEDDMVVGFVAGYQFNENEGHIFSLAVKERYKSRGIGTKLIRSILKTFYENSLQSASLEVRVSNVRAQKLYLRMGFVPCWIEKKYYYDGEDGVIMKMRTSSQCLSHDLNNPLRKQIIPNRHVPAFKTTSSV